MEWVRTSERLPSFGEEVIIINRNDGRMYISVFERRLIGGNITVPYGWRGPGPFQFFGSQVDFWMPIPERPQVGA